MKKASFALPLLLLLLFTVPCLAGSGDKTTNEENPTLSTEEQKILDVLDLLEMLELLDNMEDIAALEDNQ